MSGTLLDSAARDTRERHADLAVFPLFIWRVPHRASPEYPRGLPADGRAQALADIHRFVQPAASRY